MDAIFYILAILFAVVGLIGAFVPVLPGPVLSLVGLFFLCGVAQGEGLNFVVWSVVCGVITAADYLLPPFATKLLGGSSRGVVGATVGMILGFFFPPFGIFLGPFIGAVMGEVIHDKCDVERAFKIGFGSFVAFAVGTGLKAVYAIFVLREVLERCKNELDIIYERLF